MNAAVAHWAACCIVWEYCAGREGTFVTATWAQITQHTQDKSLQQISGKLKKNVFLAILPIDHPKVQGLTPRINDKHPLLARLVRRDLAARYGERYCRSVRWKNGCQSSLYFVTLLK